MVARIWEAIPPDLQPTAARLGHDIDEVLAGFIRGQGLVCLFLALFYGIGLWAVGLRFGLIIGLLTGFFSFIPYIGMTIGLVVGLAVAAFQFQDIVMIGLVAGVFAVGQFIEGNLISPRLVGSRIHLHPVWVHKHDADSHSLEENKVLDQNWEIGVCEERIINFYNERFIFELVDVPKRLTNYFRLFF
jgi:predicted PurR-regulated permease PerM